MLYQITFSCIFAHLCLRAFTGRHRLLIPTRVSNKKGKNTQFTFRRMGPFKFKLNRYEEKPAL